MKDLRLNRLQQNIKTDLKKNRDNESVRKVEKALEKRTEEEGNQSQSEKLASTTKS